MSTAVDLLDATENCSSLVAEKSRRFAASSGDVRVVLLLVIVAVAFLLRMQRLKDVSFWFDEACVWRISSFDWSEMWDAIAHDAHPPAFYLLQRCWQGIAGTSTLAARSLSVVCGLSAVMATGWLASCLALYERKDSSNKRGKSVLLAMLLIACSPLQIEMSQSARPYALAVTLALLATAFLIRAWQAPHQVRWWLLFCLAAAQLSFTHYVALFILAGWQLFALHEIAFKQSDSTDRSLNRLRLKGVVACLIAVQLCWMCWLDTFEFQRQRASAQLWIPPLNWDRFADVVWGTLWAGQQSGAGGLLKWLAVGVWLATPLLLFRRRDLGGRLLGIMIFSPVLLMASYSLCLNNIVGVRYLAISQAFLLVGIAHLVGHGERPFAQRCALVVLLIWCMTACGFYSQQRDSLATAAGLCLAMDSLNASRQAGEPVVVSTPFLFPSVIHAVRDRENVLLEYHGNHRLDLLGGPPLRPSDYQQTAQILAQPHRRIWTVDADGLFGERVSVAVPADAYVLESEQSFAEFNGIRLDVIVRSYRR